MLRYTLQLPTFGLVSAHSVHNTQWSSKFKRKLAYFATLASHTYPYYLFKIHKSLYGQLSSRSNTSAPLKKTPCIYLGSLLRQVGHWKWRLNKLRIPIFGFSKVRHIGEKKWSVLHNCCQSQTATACHSSIIKMALLARI